jgi:hypothetical protein
MVVWSLKFTSLSRGLVTRTNDFVGHLRAMTTGRPLVTRWLLAVPGSAALALSFTSAMPVWLPSGGVPLNGIAYPMVLAPLVWITAFVYAILAENLARCVVVMASVLSVSSALALLAITGWFG